MSDHAIPSENTYKQNISFLKFSLGEQERRIRAVDQKIGKMMVFANIPLIGGIQKYDHLRFLPPAHALTSDVLAKMAATYVLTACWVVFLYMVIKAQSSQSNPIDCIPPETAALGNGYHYMGGRYSFAFSDLFRNKVCAPKTSSEYVLQDEDAIIGEYYCELSKLTYLRDLKIHRQRWCFRAGIVFVFVLLISLRILG